MTGEEMRRLLETVGSMELELRLCRETAARLEHRCRMLAENEGGELRLRCAEARARELEAARRVEERRGELAALLSALKPVYGDLLSLRYLSRLNWQQVRMGLERRGHYYSERNVYYLHRKALAAAAELLCGAAHPKASPGGKVPSGGGGGLKQ